MDESAFSQNRRSRRSQVYLNATLEAGGASLPVRLRNLSAQGVLVEGRNLPLEGSQVIFTRNELSTAGKVIWVNGRHCGIAFDAELAPEQVLRHVPSPRPRMEPQFRRPGLGGNTISPEEKRLIESWMWSQTAHPGR